MCNGLFNLHTVTSAKLLLKKINHPVKAGIIRQLYFNREMTCADLSAELGKSIPLVTKTLGELEQDRWVKETGYADSKGGRKPMQYAMSSLSLYILSISMNRLVTKIALLNLHNEEVGEVRLIDLPLAGNGAAMKVLVGEVQQLLQEHKISTDKILGIGLAMPGFIDTALGVNYSYTFDTEGLVLRKYLSQQLSLPVFLENDSSVVALAELRFGKAKNKDVAMVLNLGWGIGLGMIVNGELFRGYSGFAGELSHIPISESEILCDCGKRGCLETEATLLVVAKKAMEKIATGEISDLPLSKDLFQMSKTVMDAANNGNQQAVELITDMGYKIGKAIAILIHIENPQTIILSGRGATVGRILLVSIQQALNTYCIPRLFAGMELEVSELGKHADLIGAASLVMEHFGE